MAVTIGMIANLMYAYENGLIEEGQPGYTFCKDIAERIELGILCRDEWLKELEKEF